MEVHHEGYVAYDEKHDCMNCGALLVGSADAGNSDTVKLRVLLHMLIMGTVQIAVLDLICRESKKTTVFDGRDKAIFAVSKATAYFRELLDF